MNIRSVRPADRGEWLRMRSALWPEEVEKELALQVDAFLRGDGTEASLLSAVFVCEIAPGTLGGFLELYVRNYAEDCEGPTPYVEGWYVDADHRGRGVGRALMHAAEEWARDYGFLELASDTTLENEASQRAHRALGFEEVERIVHYRKDL